MATASAYKYQQQFLNGPYDHFGSMEQLGRSLMLASISEEQIVFVDHHSTSCASSARLKRSPSPAAFHPKSSYTTGLAGLVAVPQEDPSQPPQTILYSPLQPGAATAQDDGGDDDEAWGFFME